MSFIVASFIPLGYPWIKEDLNDKKNIQEHMWNRMINILDENYPKKYFLQRFRSEWKKQIDFYLEKGFEISHEYPIFVCEIGNNNLEQHETGYNVIKDNGFNKENYSNVYKSITNEIDEKQLNNELGFYDSLDFDFCLQLNDKNKPSSYIGTTIRQDIKYAEISMLKTNRENKNHVINSIKLLKGELKKLDVRYLSMTVEAESPIIEILESIGFKERSKSVFVKLKR